MVLKSAILRFISKSIYKKYGYQSLVDGQDEEYFGFGSMRSCMLSLALLTLIQIVFSSVTQNCADLWYLLLRKLVQMNYNVVLVFSWEVCRKQHHLACTVFDHKHNLHCDWRMSISIFIHQTRQKFNKKCLDDPSPNNSTKFRGAHISNLEPGCKMSTSNYIFSRAKQMVIEKIWPMYVNSIKVSYFSSLAKTPSTKRLYHY